MLWYTVTKLVVKNKCKGFIYSVSTEDNKYQITRYVDE